MSAEFLHGVETIEVKSGGNQITVVRASVAVVLGIAPKGPKNDPILCLSEAQDAQFGKTVDGFNIPRTLQLIRSIAGGCAVIVINVFDETTHTTAVASETQTVVDGALQLAFPPIGTVTIKNDADTNTTAVLGTDYTLDDFGKLLVLSNHADFANGKTLKFSYKKLNPSGVLGTHLIGAVASDGSRTGAKLIDFIYTKFGYNAKILLAPGYSSLTALATEMRTIADRIRATWLHDAPYGTSVSTALTARGNTGTIGWNNAHRRSVLLFPSSLKYVDPNGTGTTDEENTKEFPYSAFMAAVMIWNDKQNGYWYSPSNKPMSNVVGAEKIITASYTDSSAENQQLNAIGITTYMNSFAAGFKTFGNRNASFPSNTDPHTFVNIVRTDDIVSESLEEAVTKHIDLPVTIVADIALQEGNNLMAALVQRGAFMAGSEIRLNDSDNPPEELAQGHITFERVYMVPPPTERITFKNRIEIQLLKNLLNKD